MGSARLLTPFAAARLAAPRYLGELARNGVRVDSYEAASQVGGLAKTVELWGHYPLKAGNALYY